MTLTNKELYSMENKLMQVYLKIITKAIPIIDNNEREIVQAAVNKLKRQIPLEKYLGLNNQIENAGIVTPRNAAFNRVQAIQTRINGGHKSLASLTRELFNSDSSLERSAYVMISSYERGEHKPRNPPKDGSVTEKYLYWLKFSGYDPFELKE